MIRLKMLYASLVFLAGFSVSFAGAPGLKEVKGDRFILDLRYNSDDNFLKTNIYKSFGLDKCYVRPEVEKKLQRLAVFLAKRRLKLVLFDCYRPVEVQREMWKIIPDPQFVADPEVGSNHNRGVAIDVGLAAEDGTPLSFPTPFDDFTKRAAHSFVCPKAAGESCRNRDLLKRLMIKAGLKPFPSEWWHYQLSEPEKYPLIERFDPKPNSSHASLKI